MRKMTPVLAVLGLALSLPSTASAQLAGGSALVLPLSQRVPNEPQHVNTLGFEAGYATRSGEHGVLSTVRWQAERDRVTLALAAGALLPASGDRRSGWLAAVGLARMLRDDPQRIPSPGVSLFAGADYLRTPESGDGWDVDMPAGLALSVSAPLSGWLPRLWLAPHAQLRLSHMAGSSTVARCGGGVDLGLMVLRNRGIGPQWGVRLVYDARVTGNPRLGPGTHYEGGIHLGIVRQARTFSGE